MEETKHFVLKDLDNESYYSIERGYKETFGCIDGAFHFARNNSIVNQIPEDLGEILVGRSLSFIEVIEVTGSW